MMEGRADWGSVRRKVSPHAARPDEDDEVRWFDEETRRVGNMEDVMSYLRDFHAAPP